MTRFCTGDGDVVFEGTESEMVAALKEAKAEVRRLNTWQGLLSLLDRHWPEGIFPTLADDDERDAGPRLVSLIRWVERLRDFAAGQPCDCYTEYGKRLSGPCERCRIVYGCESWEEFEKAAEQAAEPDVHESVPSMVERAIADSTMEPPRPPEQRR